MAHTQSIPEEVTSLLRALVLELLSETTSDDVVLATTSTQRVIYEGYKGKGTSRTSYGPPVEFSAVEALVDLRAEITKEDEEIDYTVVLKNYLLLHRLLKR